MPGSAAGNPRLAVPYRQPDARAVAHAPQWNGSTASRWPRDTAHSATASRTSAARAARAGELSSSVLLPEFLELRSAEHPVGDGRDLLGVLPRALELEQLTGERAPLGVLVCRHLQREAIDER